MNPSVVYPSWRTCFQTATEYLKIENCEAYARSFDLGYTLERHLAPEVTKPITPDWPRAEVEALMKATRNRFGISTDNADFDREGYTGASLVLLDAYHALKKAMPK